MIDNLLLDLVRRDGVRRLAGAHPATEALAGKYLAAASAESALLAAQRVNGYGLLGLVALVGSEDPDADQIAQHTQTYLDLIGRLADGLSIGNEIAVSPVLLGLRAGVAAARPRLVEIVTVAQQAGVGVTIDMGGIQDVGATLQLHRELREIDQTVGVSVQARLRRTADDCRVLGAAGARVRLCAGAYPAPAWAAYRRGQDADRAFVRCLRTLMESPAYPMVATHDRRLIPIADELAERTGRTVNEYEFQMMFGVRSIEQRRLADTGRRCRIYLPFGKDRYDYVSRQFATHPMRCATMIWRKR